MRKYWLTGAVPAVRGFHVLLHLRGPLPYRWLVLAPVVSVALCIGALSRMVPGTDGRIVFHGLVPTRSFFLLNACAFYLYTEGFCGSRQGWESTASPVSRGARSAVRDRRAHAAGRRSFPRSPYGAVPAGRPWYPPLPPSEASDYSFR